MEVERVWLNTCGVRLCLPLLLFAEIKVTVNQLRVLKMIIIHDLVEIYAGDMPAFEAAAGGQAVKEEAEKKHWKSY